MNARSSIREQIQRVREEAIVAAVNRLLATKGYDAMTVDEVAAEAGMSPGNLYRYFPSKDAIVAGLFSRLKAKYAKDGGAFPDPIVNLRWPYKDPNEGTAEEIAREINGFAIEEVKDATGKVLVEPGKTIPSFATIAAAGESQTIACGNWLYAGYFQGIDAGTRRLLEWEPKVGLEEGLKLTLDYFRKKVTAQGT